MPEGYCDGCQRRALLAPLHGPEKGGPLRCFVCAGAWQAEHGQRRLEHAGVLRELSAEAAARIASMPYRQFLARPRTERELRAYAEAHGAISPAGYGIGCESSRGAIGHEGRRRAVPGRAERMMKMSECLMALAADMFRSETRRGYIANNCSAVGGVDPNITEQDYIERFLEKHMNSDIDELEEIADIVRPSSSHTAYERELYGYDVVWVASPAKREG